MKFVKSPLNYTGGKHKLLPHLLPLFPDLTVFYDIFCGGFNVGVNVPCRKVVAVDQQPQLIELLTYWKSNPLDKILAELDDLKIKYDLTKTNKDGYLRLREDYNASPNSPMLYSLITTSFNNQVRFNSKGRWNMPFGLNRSDFNPTLRQHLVDFVTAIKAKDVEFVCGDFAIEVTDGFVYADPPYSNTCATYNERGWQDDGRLLTYLDGLNGKGVKFALSNISANNTVLAWGQKYTVHRLGNNYANCSYHKKDRSKIDHDILVCN